VLEKVRRFPAPHGIRHVVVPPLSSSARKRGGAEDRDVKKLEPPDTHHVSAAIGWLELGNPAEAGEEIARITPEMLESDSKFTGL
jgi:hypothetical protein